jgi:hypothetical protein
MSEQIEPISASKTKVVHVLPTISLDSTDMPEVADYDVGQTYDAIIHCEMISKHQGVDSYFGDDDKLPNVIRGRFRIISIKPVDSTTKTSSDKMKAIKNKASSY